MCPFESAFAPIRVDSPRTEPVIIGFTDDAFEDDTRILHVHYLARLFINNSVDPAQYPVNTTAVGEHFRIEPQPAIFLLFVQRRHDLSFRPHLNKFAGLEVQQSHGSSRSRPFAEWIARAPTPSRLLTAE